MERGRVRGVGHDSSWLSLSLSLSLCVFRVRKTGKRFQTYFPRSAARFVGNQPRKKPILRKPLTSTRFPPSFSPRKGILRELCLLRVTRASRNNDTSLASVLVQPSLLTAKIRLPDSDESVYLRRRFFFVRYLCTGSDADGVNGRIGYNGLLAGRIDDRRGRSRLIKEKDSDRVVEQT